MRELTLRARKCLQQLELVSSLEGDIAEFGVWRGDTTARLALFLKQNGIDKKVYAFDTFHGLPYHGKDGIDACLRAGECSMPFQKFWATIVDAGVEDYVVPVPGLVEVTFNNFEDHTFCFTFLDLDLYEPTSYVAKRLQKCITPGGIMGFHDYKFVRCPGIEIVVDREVDRNIFVMIGDHVDNCAWLQKRVF